MANRKEIRDRMKSIQETMQITNAMYLISSSKLKKTRRQLESVEPYFEKIQSTISDILLHSQELSHPFFDKREEVKEKKVGYVVITADKGMAGSFNQNVCRLAEQSFEKNQQAYLFLVGQMGRHYFNKKNVMIDGEFLYTAQNPTVYRANRIAATLLDLFKNGLLDEVYIAYTRMVSTVNLKPEIIKLLPLDRQNLKHPDGMPSKYEQVATYVPSPEVVLSSLVPNYVKGIIFGCLVESFSSEQAARMTAMKSACDNAKEMIRDLSLQYNRARQAAITQEISEIVGGAEALK